MRSKISTLASTAMPIVSAMPAMPGSVSVACSAVSAPSSRIRFAISAMLAKMPKRPYIAPMNTTTRTTPTMEATSPASTESAPRPAPMLRSSMITSLAGSAPERSSSASREASACVKLPVMMPAPPQIASLMRG